VTFVPLITWPILTLDIVLILTSIVLALFILLHKGRGGGLSDLFGGGMSSAMGGKSIAERNLDKLTIIVGAIWLVCILGLLMIFRFFPTVGELGDPAESPTPGISANATDPAQSDAPQGSEAPVGSEAPTESPATPAQSPVEPASSPEASK
jgi:preprotein translocase subunit SecG